MPEPNWQNKKCKHGYTILIEKHYNHIAAWQMDSQEKLLIEIDIDPDRVSTIILDMCNIYTKYLNPTNNNNKQYNQIQTIILKLEQELQISNNERKIVITLLKMQVAKSNCYKKMIDMLQNSLFTKKNQPQQLIKRSIPAQQSPVFVYSLFSLLNDQRSVTCMPQPSEIDSNIDKLTKTLPNRVLFTDRKNLSIDQWLLKIQGKFEINLDHYSSEKSKLIYVENKVQGKALQHLKPCL